MNEWRREYRASGNRALYWPILHESHALLEKIWFEILYQKPSEEFEENIGDDK